MTIPPPRALSLDQIRRDVLSATQGIRGYAMQSLLMQCRADSALHAAALPIFQAHVFTAPDYMTAANAARGIELIAGPDEGRKVWITLLNRGDAKFAAEIATATKDVFYVPALLRMLESRPDFAIQTAVMRTLGRMKDAQAFAPIAARLADRSLRPHAIEALSDLGDRRAIPHIEPLLKDKTDAWPEDNHGPMLRVCDLASSALSQLRSVK
jgi:hypothetical protein